MLHQAELHPDYIQTNFEASGSRWVPTPTSILHPYCATSVPTLSLKGVTSNGEGPITDLLLERGYLYG